MDNKVTIRLTRGKKWLEDEGHYFGYFIHEYFTTTKTANSICPIKYGTCFLHCGRIEITHAIKKNGSSDYIIIMIIIVQAVVVLLILLGPCGCFIYLLAWTRDPQYQLIWLDLVG